MGFGVWLPHFWLPGLVLARGEAPAEHCVSFCFASFAGRSSGVKRGSRRLLLCSVTPCFPDPMGRTPTAGWWHPDAGSRPREHLRDPNPAPAASRGTAADPEREEEPPSLGRLRQEARSDFTCHWSCEGSRGGSRGLITSAGRGPRPPRLKHLCAASDARGALIGLIRQALGTSGRAGRPLSWRWGWGRTIWAIWRLFWEVD